MFRRAIFFLAALASVFAFPVHSPAQDLPRRLILKDGSYQAVAKYEVKGDRVRYLSSERDEWEELPAVLVDWPATEKYEKDRAAGASVPEAVQLDKELEAERALDEARLPQVAPGLRIPADDGVFLLDNFKGEPQLVELQQTAGDVDRNTKGNIFRGAINPIASARQSFVIPGEHAAVQAHAEVPSLYINVDQGPDLRARIDEGKAPADNTGKPDSARTQQPQQPQQPQQARVPFDRYRIVRTQVKGGKRIVGDVKRAVTGKISQDEHFVKTTVDRVIGGWLKVTPIEPLTPGEYALVEMEGNEGMNLYVWDFGVNPNAAANANPWKPEAKETAKPKPNN